MSSEFQSALNRQKPLTSAAAQSHRDEDDPSFTSLLSMSIQPALCDSFNVAKTCVLFIYYSDHLSLKMYLIGIIKSHGLADNVSERTILVESFMRRYMPCGGTQPAHVLKLSRCVTKKLRTAHTQVKGKVCL